MAAVWGSTLYHRDDLEEYFEEEPMVDTFAEFC